MENFSRMFAKVFEQIFDSSIAEDYRVRLVFEDLLKLACKAGIVDMTPQAISRRTNVPLKIVTHGLSELEKPDKHSRTPDCEGRRIVRLDEHRTWGWQIVNHEKYRLSATKEMLRMGDAERKRAYRKKFPPRSPLSKESEVDTDKEADREAEQSKTVSDMSRTRPLEANAVAASGQIGVTEKEASDWWHTREANDWMKGTAGGGTTPVGKNWQSDLKIFTNNARSRTAERKANGNHKHSSKPDYTGTSTAGDNLKRL